MKQINLTKKAVGSGHLRVGEKFITNGHWACWLALVKQAALLSSVESTQALFPRADVSDLTDGQMAQVVPHFSDPVVFTRTDWVKVDGTGDTCLFEASNGSKLWLDRKYVELFDLDAVTGESCPGKVSWDPAMVGTFDDWQVIIMPKRLDEDPPKDCESIQ